MAAYEIEVILTRQLADCLSFQFFITDTTGRLIFYNEPAEVLQQCDMKKRVKCR